MGSRNTRVRSKVVALLLSLTALWAFAAYVTVREGLNMLWVSVAANDVGIPLDDLTKSLQEERRLSVSFVSGDAAAAAQLAAAREATDTAMADMRSRSSSRWVRWTESGELRQRLADFDVAVAEVESLRGVVDRRDAAGLEVVEGFTTIIDSAFVVNRSLASWDDKGLANAAQAVVTMAYARELMTREDAIISGALAAGDITTDDRTTFSQVVGTRRHLHDTALEQLTGDTLAQFELVRASDAYQQFEAVEDQLMAGDPGQPSIAPATWRSASDAMIRALRDFEDAQVDAIITQATPVVIGTVVRLALLGGLGLAAVIASIIISITTARQLVRQLERLRNAARDLASYRLPRVVERLQQGEQVDVKQEAPPLEFGRDEIGQVGEAFNQVQETAIRVAVEQAELRRSVRDVFLSLARRSQALLHRQLGLLDAMERRTTDSEELAELFRIDHLATRMRRNAENLIVLSGATAGRAWRKPVPMVDVVRGALAEVEDYTRVTVLPVGNAALLGRAVGDVIHLLAELIENAVLFSPPQTTVRVGGSVVGYGFAIEIEDRGLGMSPEELATANEQLRDPPEFRLTSTARLGLYVVGKLAERHGIRVRLTESPYGGTTAIVLLPGSIMADGDTEDPLDPSQLDSYRPAQLAGVGRHRLRSGADRPAVSAETGTALADPLALPAGPTERNGSWAAPLPSTNGNGGPAALASPPAATAPARSTEPPKLTPSGLPWRQRQSADELPTQATGPAVSSARVSAGGGLTGGFATVAPSGADRPPAPPRDPDTTRTMMASYRSGTLRGRSEAARLVESGPDVGEGDAEHPTDTPEDQGPQGTGSAPRPEWTQSTTETPQWTESTETPQWTQSTEAHQ